MNTKNNIAANIDYIKLYLKNIKEQTKSTLLVEVSKNLAMQKGLDPQANIDAVLLDTADGTKSWIKVVTFNDIANDGLTKISHQEILDRLYELVAQECSKDFYTSSKTTSKGTLLVVCESSLPVFTTDTFNAFIVNAYDKKRFNNSYRVPKSCFNIIVFGALITDDTTATFATSPVWQRSTTL